MATGLGLGFSLLLLAVLGQYIWWALPLSFLWGVGFGLLPIAVQSWMFHAAPRHLEVVQALLVSLAQTAIGIGALAGGLIVDNFGVKFALLAASIISLATVALTLFNTRSNPATSASSVCRSVP